MRSLRRCGCLRRNPSPTIRVPLTRHKISLTSIRGVARIRSQSRYRPAADTRQPLRAHAALRRMRYDVHESCPLAVPRYRHGERSTYSSCRFSASSMSRSSPSAFPGVCPADFVARFSRRGSAAREGCSGCSFSVRSSRGMEASACHGARTAPRGQPSLDCMSSSNRAASSA
jgi:hypothetical protein